MYASDERVRRWIEEEVADMDCAHYFAVSVADAYSALGEAPGQVIVVDVDSLAPQELVDLELIAGSELAHVFIALGKVTNRMRQAFRITHALPRPLGSEKLRAIIAGL